MQTTDRGSRRQSLARLIVLLPTYYSPAVTRTLFSLPDKLFVHVTYIVTFCQSLEANIDLCKTGAHVRVRESGFG